MLRITRKGALLVGALTVLCAATPIVAQENAQTDDIRAAVLQLDTKLTEMLTSLEADIAQAEAEAGFGASAETLDQISTLKARRDDLLAKREELQTLLPALQVQDD